MSLRVHYEILNQKGTPAFFSDTYANRPTFGYQGRVFISTDTGQIFEDTGTSWSLIADAGVGGGTLASVCANGNTTATGIVITAGNLGINTSSPGAPLDIHGTGTNASFNGTGTNNAYLLFQNSGTSKWRIGNTYSAGANTFNIYNNNLGTNALTIYNSTNETIFAGSVGIGSGTNPTFPLDVVGNTRITGQLSAFASGGTGYGLYVQGISNQYAARIIGNSDTGFSYGLTIQAGTNGTDSPFTITNYAASSTLLKVTGTGNVGIGTSSPSTPLEIVKGATTGIKITNNTAGYASMVMVGGHLEYYKDATPTYAWATGMETPANSLNNDYSFASYSGSSWSERMRITAGGNVGIGTSSPISPANNYRYLHIEGANTTSGGVLYLSTFGNGNSSQIYTDTSGLNINTNTSLPIIFNPAGTERMRINTSGQILINTTAALSVEPVLAIKGNTNSTAMEIQIATNSYYGIRFRNSSGTQAGYIQVDASSVTYGTGSDYRLKKDFKDYNGLELINKIKTYDFAWNIDDTRMYGVIAHELQEVISYAVSGKKDKIDLNGKIIPQGVDYSKLVPILIKSIQELNEKLERNNIN